MFSHQINFLISLPWASLPLQNNDVFLLKHPANFTLISHPHTCATTQVNSLQEEDLSTGIQRELPVGVRFLETAVFEPLRMQAPALAFLQQLKLLKALNTDRTGARRLVQFARSLQVVWAKIGTRMTPLKCGSVIVLVATMQDDTRRAASQPSL